MIEIYGIIHNKEIKENEALLFSTGKSFEKITGTYIELKIITKDKVLLLNNANIMFSPEKRFYYVITYEKLKINKEKSILYPVMKEFQSVLL